ARGEQQQHPPGRRPRCRRRWRHAHCTLFGYALRNGRRADSASPRGLRRRHLASRQPARWIRTDSMDLSPRNPLHLQSFGPASSARLGWSDLLAPVRFAAGMALVTAAFVIVQVLLVVETVAAALWRGARGERSPRSPSPLHP